MKQLKFFLVLLMGLAGVQAAIAQGTGSIALKVTPADRRAGAAASSVLAAAQAGMRVVAVGERGVVLLSDDGGAQWRQARSVPASGTLTGVSFADAQVGWAVGHWGLVLHTVDGGETWSIQRQDLEQDQPLLAVYFKDKNQGVAVGLWSHVLVTQDGGNTWEKMTNAVQHPSGTKPLDVNIYSIFPGSNGALYATAEQGLVLRSNDMGRHWEVFSTGYTGSLWSGVALRNGDLLVGGLRGTLLRSADGGQSWQKLEHPGRSSITGLVQSAGGKVTGTALDGTVLASSDGRSFEILAATSRAGNTGALALGDGAPLLMTRSGPCRLDSCQ